MRVRCGIIAGLVWAGCAGSRAEPGFDAGDPSAGDAIALREDVAVVAVTDAVTDVPGVDAGARTVLRVRHGLGMRALSLRGDAPGLLTWTRGVALRRVSDEVSEWSSDAVRAPFAWKPLGDDTAWSLGPNFAARPGETTEVWARFGRENGVARRWRGDFRSVALANVRGVCGCTSRPRTTSTPRVDTPWSTCTTGRTSSSPARPSAVRRGRSTTR
jgi:hypothetical protein